ncbi:FecCD family ABC transporter permease [Nocardioides alcanivorans]|uniref:FecCD family ABC transporter permease n=1 Tax=Nocardioides alcanivorans TaxID=2897352 RepID=UPI001F41F48A|nr:iron ABC transporter permease [Nocardioides alcanivorans]
MTGEGTPPVRERSSLPVGHRVLRPRGNDGWSLRFEVRPAVVTVILVVLLVSVVLASLVIGEFRITAADAVSTLLGNPPDRITDFFIYERRLPRALVAVVVGASLATSGAVFCALTRNPLASPDIIGVTQGASAGGAVVLLLLGGGLAQVAAGAVTGAVVTSGLIALLAWWRGLSGARLVLLGVALGAVASAIVAHLLARVFVASAVTAQTWLIGSLQGRGWSELRLPLLCLVLAGAVVWKQSANLRALALGDEVAVALGVRVGRTRALLLVAATLTAAFAVATAGPISFVALVAPHVARMLTRSDRVLPAALVGGLLLLVSDLVAQHAFALPVPVGVVTVVLGGLFFLGLLWREGRRG